VRLRSPENIAAEMALTPSGRGGRQSAIFCFHDDNFLFPSEKLSHQARARHPPTRSPPTASARWRSWARRGQTAVTPALAKELAALGVIRLYVGVENGAETGGDHLLRGTQQAHVRAAMKAVRRGGDLRLLQPARVRAEGAARGRA
jgi:hypothetical protein